MERKGDGERLGRATGGDEAKSDREVLEEDLVEKKCWTDGKERAIAKDQNEHLASLVCAGRLAGGCASLVASRTVRESMFD